MEDIFANSLESIREFEGAKKQHGAIRGVTGTRATSTGAANNGGDKLAERTQEVVTTEIALTQQAYIDGLADETPIYKAHGIDREGNEYEVEWEVVENWDLIEDEQEMVEDWDKPVSVDKI
ncbi:hypothetical protein J2Z83_003713 [Virgibacillus natechei]|uniref:PepSY domain-containing protein n=1 Tax=Virgibacillus natechei TaxID=1216297 RepID=A0ABS4IKU1_9BACI|nr:hypothetical protein [Virgibacillus natechei]MBP1971562.1 hypothetical protein [Virgibacillus natechei]UZD13102.1 hypothetical protein OLD84_00555 [Virgibacillus natechei]